MDKSIQVLPDGSDRLIALRINTANVPILLINTYLPTEGTHTGIKYHDITDEVYEVIQKYQPGHHIIWTGDMNADLERNTTSNDRALKAFCKENSLLVNPLLPSPPTFHHFNKISHSRIDLVIHPDKQEQLMRKVTTDSHNPINTSCHDAVVMHTIAKLPAVQQSSEVHSRKNTDARIPLRRAKWDKVNIEHYSRITGRKLAKLAEYADPDLPTEVYIMRINSILQETAEQCSPAPKRPGKPKTFKWSPTLKPLVDCAKSKFHTWKQCGRPTDPNHHAYTELNNTTKELRQMQRQIAADERRSRHMQIMTASQDDKDLFYQLVRRQRQDGQTSCATIDFPFDQAKDNSQVNNWAAYFSQLATPANLPHFDEEFRQHTETKYLLLQLLTPKMPVPPIPESVITKHIRSLKLSKAPDAYGVQAEHVKYAHSSLVPILTDVINRIYTTQSIPDVLKLGTVTPVPKKQKAKNKPDSYRRITVNPIVGKILEEEMVPSTNRATLPNSSRNQFGFKDGVSCNNAAVLLTEMLMEAKDAKQAIFVSYMDTTKAFDMVHHPGLLCALHDQGVRGPLWNLYSSAYSNVRSEVKWAGALSREFSEGQGIRQGAKTSTGAFNSKADPLLHSLSTHPDGYTIGTTNVGAIMVADDLALASTTRHGLQSLMHIAEHDAATKRYLFSESKTKIQVSSTKSPQIVVSLNGKPVDMSDEEIHLGIARRADLSNKSTVEMRIQTARRTAYALAGAGLYGLNGVGPNTIMQLINIYILPRLTYGLECLTLTTREIEPMETYYRNLLRQIQHLPPTTANPAVYMLVGALPVEALIHQKVLCMFGAITRRDESLEYEIMERQLGMKDRSSSSWAIHVKKLLARYELPGPVELLYSMKSKDVWKACVKQHVWCHWYKQLREEAESKSTLRYLNLEGCEPGKVHHVWAQDSLDPLAVHRATVHAHILVQRYPINTSHTSKRKSHPCPCCQTSEETLEHFLLQCKATAHIRSQYMPRIVCELQRNNIPNSTEDRMQAILDPSKLLPSSVFVRAVTNIARSLCFHLHKKRLTFSGSTQAKTINASTTTLKSRRNILNYRDPTVTADPGAPKQRGGTSG